MERDFATAREHPTKNRYPDLHPCTAHYITITSYLYIVSDGEYMPFLRPSPNEDSYINASFIDVTLPLSLIKLAPLTITILQGYKYNKAYIATQGPLLNTTEDMWRMVWEVKSKVMVLLCSFTEDGHEACHPFWPNSEGDTAQYGRMTVTLQSQTSLGDFTSRKLLVVGEQVW